MDALICFGWISISINVAVNWFVYAPIILPQLELNCF
jgi:hypothetical protein